MGSVGTPSPRMAGKTTCSTSSNDTCLARATEASALLTTKLFQEKVEVAANPGDVGQVTDVTPAGQVAELAQDTARLLGR
jgi:hypothetical protein